MKLCLVKRKSLAHNLLLVFNNGRKICSKHESWPCAVNVVLSHQSMFQKRMPDYVMTQWSSWHLCESFNTVGLDIYGWNCLPSINLALEEADPESRSTAVSSEKLVNHEHQEELWGFSCLVRTWSVVCVPTKRNEDEMLTVIPVWFSFYHPFGSVYIKV